jgi:serine/threonine protein kinase
MSSRSSGGNESLEIFEKFLNSNEIGKVLGKGAFGEVRDVIIKGKTMAGKIIKKEKFEQTDEEKYSEELRGQNIIKISKILQKKIGESYYSLIIMEKAVLRDLGKLNEFYFRHNLLKMIYNPFKGSTGDIFLRFYAKQIVNAIKTLDENYYVHYDLKLENLLMITNLIIKLSDFSILRKVKDGIFRIPGGTPGYLTPEYYIEREVTSENARKQDYFALGSCIFQLKYGESFLKYKKYDENKINAQKIIELLEQKINFTLSNKFNDIDFIRFLNKLIQYKPKDRPTFDNIYRNKWLNKDSNHVNDTFQQFEADEEKLIMEFQKKDYLLDKEDIIEKKVKEYIEKRKKLENTNKIKQNKQNTIQNKNKATYLQKKYIFKKKNIN